MYEQLPLWVDAPAAPPQYGSMTEQAPQAHTQYDGQRWHVEFRMHIDMESPAETYLSAELSKKVPTADGHTWATQTVYDWLPVEIYPPHIDECLDGYLLVQLEMIQRWLSMHHDRAALTGKDQGVRPELGVSVQEHPYPEV